jgi:hypothetical protein
MNKKEKAKIDGETVEKWVTRNDRTLASQRRRLTAMVCTLAVWFSFSVGQSVQAAQSDHWNSATPVVSESGVPQAVGVTESLLATSSGLAIIAASLITFTLISYSLLSAGKRGWGWATLCIAGGILMIFVKLATALFQEVSSDDGIQDWDT